MLRRAVARMLLPRLAAGALHPRLAAALHHEVRADPELAAAYDALRRCERLAAQADPVPLSSGQRDLLEALVLGAVSSEAAARPAPRRSSWAMPASAAGLAACCALAFVALPQRSSDAERTSVFGVGDLEARSARIAAHPVGVKVTCVRDAQVLGSAAAGVRQTGAALPCPHGSLLAFSTTNLGQAERHVFAVGVAGDGTLRWYAPFSRASGSVPVAAGAVDDVLPTLADTASMPRDARVSLFVLISDAPIDGAAVERQVQAAAARGVPVASLERLPLADVPVQARIDVMVGAGGP